MLVALTGLDGVDCYVNPANVVSLTQVPMSVSGGQAATYINDADSTSRLSVLGAPSDIAALLDAGGAVGVACVSRGFVDGATGAVTMFSGVTVTGVRNSAGRYTLTPNPLQVIEAPSISLTATSDVIISQDGPVGATFGVAIDDAADAPTDDGFIFHVFGTLQA